ncbi:hypothetical protein GCM10010441_43310 [Kitasatospora paracochleata]
MWLFPYLTWATIGLIGFVPSTAPPAPRRRAGPGSAMSRPVSRRATSRRTARSCRSPRGRLAGLLDAVVVGVGDGAEVEGGLVHVLELVGRPVPDTPVHL